MHELVLMGLTFDLFIVYSSIMKHEFGDYFLYYLYKSRISKLLMDVVICCPPQQVSSA